MNFFIKKNMDWNPGLGYEAIGDTLQAIGAAAAEFMLERATEYAPKDTGYMASTIGVLSEIDRPGRSVAGNYVHTIFCMADYARYVEFGYYSIAGTWIPPQPFMRRAIADTAERWPEIAGQFKLGQHHSRYVSEARAPQESVFRHHTYQSKSHQKVERGVGSDSGGK